jgi:hypothetical protein
MGNVRDGQGGGSDFEAHIVSVNDAGEALIIFTGGARMLLRLTEEQSTSYRTAKLRERARAGTLVSTAGESRDTGWPADKVFDVVIGDSNWFYC